MTNRYQFNDRETYAMVLERTDPMSALANGAYVADPALFKRVCWEATEAVPMTVSSLNNRKREREIRTRLLEALEWRDRRYRELLPAVGRMQ